MLHLPAKLFHIEDFHLTPWQALVASVTVIVGLKVVTTVYQALYNVLFHPLRRFPGPVTWIAAPWLKNLSQIRGRADHEIVALHEKLGPVVRVGPDTLSFTSGLAWKDIYGTGHAELPKHIYKGSGMEERPNIITAHPRDHHRFRKAMMPAITSEAISREEPLIMGYVDMLVQHLRNIAQSSDPVANVAKWYTMTTFDVFGDLCYGESFNGLASGEQHPWIKSMSSMKLLVPLLVFPYISWLLVLLLLPAAERNSLRDHQKRSYSLTMKRIAEKDTHPRNDFMTFMLRNRSDDHGVTDHELASNSDIIISAGSETTSTALTGITYFLTSNQDALARCTREVREAFSSDDEISFSGTLDLPYMLACIEEGLRMYPPVPTSLIRRTLPGRPMLIDGHLIPENTVVGVHHLATYKSKRNFHDPKSYRPERWLPEAREDPESLFYDDNRDCVRPFSYGPRNCIGRNLAYHEMRLILAKVLWHFDLKLKPGYENWGVNQRTYQLWEKPELMVQFKEREMKV
ncbi:Isotrichodermin C-15 hydroxylase [Tolypocladium ophioglossoides CBS 100239]|uniref:Isotrichodermin C-15 hydroxylase n=1 Tax=Tolypocladium ophioglossoides (strain CBS 100239) TaxID=1163406 RepID=A0A0L0MXM5_TOLOC|nr:Isotrichodermin C-15 hydroxylase [Tolypocladium ophioglossoides CBS 100239]